MVAGKSLAKKDIFGASDPYVRIDLNTINADVNIDSVLTKTKKKVRHSLIFINVTTIIHHYHMYVFYFLFVDIKSRMERGVHLPSETK